MSAEVRMIEVLGDKDFAAFSKQIRNSIRHKKRALVRAKALDRRKAYCQRTLDDEISYARKHGVNIDAI